MLIGLHGRKRAGKDTVADFLTQRHRYARYALAGPIRDGLIAMLGTLGVDRAALDGADKELPLPVLGVSSRHLQQTLGTEWGRQLVHPDVWLMIARARVTQIRGYTSTIVITDVRFENEAAWMRMMGGAVWHIRRPRDENVVDLHKSEAGVAIVPGIDSILDNSAGLEQLADEVKRALAGECVFGGAA